MDSATGFQFIICCCFWGTVIYRTRIENKKE